MSGFITMFWDFENSKKWIEINHLNLRIFFLQNHGFLIFCFFTFLVVILDLIDIEIHTIPFLIVLMCIFNHLKWHYMQGHGFSRILKNLSLLFLVHTLDSINVERNCRLRRFWSNSNKVWVAGAGGLAGWLMMMQISI